MLKPITNKGLFWELRNSIWTLWTFFPFGFFNYISFFYIAARLKDKKLFVYGVLYAIPFVNIMIMDSIKNFPSWYTDFSYFTIFIVWIISIFHCLKVRRHYLLSKANFVSYADKLAEENRQLQEKLQSLMETTISNNDTKINDGVLKETISVVDNHNTIFIPLNLNVATEQELASINEIGPLLANKIILERQKVGNFKNYKHFEQVMGFKPHIAHKLKKYVIVQEIDVTQQSNSTSKGRVIDY